MCHETKKITNTGRRQNSISNFTTPYCRGRYIWIILSVRSVNCRSLVFNGSSLSKDYGCMTSKRNPIVKQFGNLEKCLKSNGWSYQSNIKHIINKGKKCLRLLSKENEFHADKNGSKRVTVRIFVFQMKTNLEVLKTNCHKLNC